MPDVFSSSFNYIQKILFGLSLWCWFFLIPNTVQSATTASATIQWEANQESDLAGYRIYHGTAPGVYGLSQTVGKTTTYQYPALESNKTHFFTVTAYDTSGNESLPSTEVSKYIIAADLPPPSSIIISNLTVVSGKSYGVPASGLQAGSIVYIDRPYTFTTVPASVQGAAYIQTANDDKGDTTATFLRFDVNQPVTVQVAHDVRITPKPSWLGVFTDTGQNLVTMDATLRLFARSFPAGTVTLGGNASGGGFSMYSVIIQPQGGGTTNQAPNGVINTPSGAQTIQVGQALTFTGTSTDPEPNLPLTHRWTFGTGAGIPDATVEDPGAVTFNSAGVFTVRYTVTDALGLADPTPATVQVTVNSGPPPSFSIIISNLTVVSGKSYVVPASGLQAGSIVYIDRPYTFTTVPASVQGAAYIQTANDDKGDTTATFLRFDVNQPVTVQVAHDVRITPKPSWLGVFTDTGQNLVTMDATLRLFARSFPAGTVTLGGNASGGGFSMYSVIIQPHDEGGSSLDTLPPTIALVAPGNGVSVSGTITVSAKATDNVGVAGVQFQLNGNNLGAEDTSAPFSITWDTTKVTRGQYTLTAIARDVAGNTTSSSPVIIDISSPSSILSVSVSGSGRVISSPTGIQCTNGTCSTSYENGSSITLSAQADKRWKFSGWSGACSGTGECVVQLTKNQIVGAIFSSTGNGRNK